MLWNLEESSNKNLVDIQGYESRPAMGPSSQGQRFVTSAWKATAMTCWDKAPHPPAHFPSPPARWCLGRCGGPQHSPGPHCPQLAFPRAPRLAVPACRLCASLPIPVGIWPLVLKESMQLSWHAAAFHKLQDSFPPKNGLKKDHQHLYAILCMMLSHTLPCIITQCLCSADERENQSGGRRGQLASKSLSEAGLVGGAALKKVSRRRCWNLSSFSLTCTPPILLPRLQPT